MVRQQARSGQGAGVPAPTARHRGPLPGLCHALSAQESFSDRAAATVRHDAAATPPSATTGMI